MNLDLESMKKISGGGVSVWAIFGIGSLVVFLAGVIDGFARPLACNK